MGRKSRAKKEHPRDPKLRNQRIIRQAEFRGRLVAPTVQGYEAAVARSGQKGLREALIARHNLRWDGIYRGYAKLGPVVFGVLLPVFAIDLALFETGLDTHRPPSSPYGKNWEDQLSWGVDSAIAATRLMLAGQFIGATAIVRTQLERWTENRAFSNNKTRTKEESTGDFYYRVWKSSGTLPTDIKEAWIGMSEFLHGRGPLLPLLSWETRDLMAEHGETPTALIGPILGAQILALRQVRYCVANLVEDKGQTEFASNLRQTLEYIIRPADPASPPAAALWPITYDMLSEDGVIRMEEIFTAYQNNIKNAKLRFPVTQSISQSTLGSFVSRRWRSIVTARRAFVEEEAVLGEDFKPQTVQARMQFFILICEMGALAGDWSDDDSGNALLVGSGAVRSAFWLWLEDDDRAMVLVRTALEQTARARVWRMKPDRAKELEARNAITTPRDWLREAGWRRLSIFNRSLGEFAHASPRSRWYGARQVLASLQNEANLLGSDPVYTARGAALDAVGRLYGLEVAHQLSKRSVTLGEAFKELVRLGEGTEQEIETWLSTVWSQRAQDFGDGDFSRPLDDSVQ